jgi:hypothetical protein
MQPTEKMSHGELSILGAAGREGQVTVEEGADDIEGRIVGFLFFMAIILAYIIR